MLNDKTVAVVVPAYNEEEQIMMVINKMPHFVDRIIVVNDASVDNTSSVVKKHIKNSKDSPRIISKELNPKETIYNQAELILKKAYEEDIKFFPAQKTTQSKNSKVVLIDHLDNSGVGAAIASGYRWCRNNNIDCTAVMAGDGQMDPSELVDICEPIIENKVDYVKGNRLTHQVAHLVVPRIRYFGNSVLSLLTKIASGYWRISDTQTGYTAISLRALRSIALHKIYPSYGCPNDILVKLNIAFMPIAEVDSKPVYNVGEKSKMKIIKVIPTVSWLLIKSFFKRLYTKYLLKDFHPLFLLYHLAFILLIFDIPFIWQVVRSITPNTTLPDQSLIIFIFLTITALQSFFFAMWMDMLDNERLQR